MNHITALTAFNYFCASVTTISYTYNSILNHYVLMFLLDILSSLRRVRFDSLDDVDVEWLKDKYSDVVSEASSSGFFFPMDHDDLIHELPFDTEKLPDTFNMDDVGGFDRYTTPEWDSSKYTLPPPAHKTTTTTTSTYSASTTTGGISNRLVDRVKTEFDSYSGHHSKSYRSPLFTFDNNNKKQSELLGFDSDFERLTSDFNNKLSFDPSPMFGPLKTSNLNNASLSSSINSLNDGFDIRAARIIESGYMSDINVVDAVSESEINTTSSSSTYDSTMQDKRWNFREKHVRNETILAYYYCIFYKNRL